MYVCVHLVPVNFCFNFLGSNNIVDMETYDMGT